MYIVSYLLANGKHNIEPNIARNDYRNDLLSIPVTTGEQTACLGTVSPRVPCEDHADCCSGCPTAESVVNSDSLLLVYLVEYIYIGPYSVHAGSYSAIPKGSKGYFM